MGKKIEYTCYAYIARTAFLLYAHSYISALWQYDICRVTGIRVRILEILIYNKNTSQDCFWYAEHIHNRNYIQENTWFCPKV